MKLAKKNNVPVLSFEIFGTTHMGRQVKVAHDVRIEVMKPADTAMLTEPRCPEPDVRHIESLSGKEPIMPSHGSRFRSCFHRSPRCASLSSACATSPT